MADVICLGIVVADLLARPVDAWPERGKLVLTKHMELHIGGCAANTAIGLTRLGIPTGVVAKVGDDPLGEFVINALSREGVDSQGVKKDASAQTSTTMVCVHGDGERSLIHCVGANAALQEADVSFELMKGAQVLHVAGSLLMPGFDGDPTARVLKRAKEMGLITTLDTAWDGSGRWMTTMSPVFAYVDYALPSIEEARMLTGRQDPPEVARELIARGVKTVALKMGEHGCYLRDDSQELTIPAFQVEAVDASGAGDAFAAGFLAGLVKGWDLESTGRLANATGALCTLALGTTAGLRSYEETKRFMRTAPSRAG